jgi:hypothetical protein
LKQTFALKPADSFEANVFTDAPTKSSSSSSLFFVVFVVPFIKEDAGHHRQALIAVAYRK